MTDQTSTETVDPDALAPIPAPPTTEDLVAELLATRLLCLGCVVEHRRASLAGTPEGELPNVNIAQVVVQGNGQCLGHVQFVDGPVMPGQTASGIYLPGQGN